MDEIKTIATANNEESAKHYGTPRHSGRYPWGSGENPQRHKTLLGRIDDLHKQGLTEKEIASALGYKSTTELRAAKSIATNEEYKSRYETFKKMRDEGMGYTAIGRATGYSEGTVRSTLKSKLATQGDLADATVTMLKARMTNEYPYVNVTAGAEAYLGISETKFKTSVAKLKEEGYSIQNVQIDQLGTAKGNKTTIQVLAPPGTTYKDLKKEIENNTFADKIRPIDDVYSEDAGASYKYKQPPVSVDSKRIYIRYAEEGGADKDGVVELRPGVPDISLGKAKYAQVRIAVDNDLYIKGMAVYGKVPEGYDMVVNSNKHEGTPLDKTLKKMNRDLETGEIDTVNPFGAAIKEDARLNLVNRTYIDKDGKEKQSAINVVYEQGDWSEWKDKIPAQFLSKQNPDTIKKQLNLTYAIKEDAFSEIKSVTNPVLKRKLLNEFADECDTSTEHLKAAAFANQKYAVILPVNSLKDNEIYAPNHNNGDHVALIRFPHAGTFEIPVLTVNNKNKEAKEVIGNAIDAVGIGKKAAQQLSGADFDGDTVLVINTKDVNIKATPAVQELIDFDTKTYKYPQEVIDNPNYKKMADSTKQKEMGIASNLITDMTIRNAPLEDMVKAVKHSMVVIDAQKHDLDYHQSEIDNDIKALKMKYQRHPDGSYGGASTLISQAKAEDRVPEHKEFRSTAKMNEDQKRRWFAGERVFEDEPVTRGSRPLYEKVKEGRYIVKDENGKPLMRPKLDENGNKIYVDPVKLVKRTRMSQTDDAFTLSTGTVPENLYAAYANKLKAMANEARKEARAIGTPKVDKSIAPEYREERRSLMEKVKNVKKNAPKEQQAQIIGNKLFKQVEEANPKMSNAEASKQRARYLKRAREITGAKRELIDITDREWEAIQRGAITSQLQIDVFKSCDPDRLKARAMPRPSNAIPTSKINLAKARLEAGYTQAEVASELGVSPTTLMKQINGN